MTTDAAPKPKHFFKREGDGSARVRMKFMPEEVSRYEEAAGTLPVMIWLHQAINRAAEEDLQEQRRAKAAIPPPE